MTAAFLAAAGTVTLIAAAGIALNHFDPHKGTRQRGHLTPDQRADRAALERASQDRLMGRTRRQAPAVAPAPQTIAYKTDGQLAGYWPMGAGYWPANQPGSANEEFFGPGPYARAQDNDPDNGLDKTRADIAYPLAGAASRVDIATVRALVYDDPVPGREYDEPLDVRHHAPQPGMRPYCSRCGRYGHWTGEQCPPAAAAIAGHLRAAGLKVHDSNDDAVNSIVMRALNGPRAIEGARQS